MNKTSSENYINNIIKSINNGSNRINKADKVCAPGLKYEAGSCATLKVLKELSKAYNTSADSNSKIKLSDNYEILNPQKYKKYLVHELSQRIGKKCNSQKCWSRQDFVRYMNEQAKEEFIRYTFRPNSPQGKWEWLSTYDIDDAMSQYEKKYKGFRFLGAVPMDFASLPSLEASSINYDNYKNNGITKIGIVFNLDNHDQPGSHWVAMYSDMDKGNIFYFDSFGVKPEKRVRALMREQVRHLQKKGMNLNDIRVDYNKNQHQKGDSECGVYSMNFLIKMAKGDDFDNFCKNPNSDKKINKCRKVYFDKYHKRKF